MDRLVVVKFHINIANRWLFMNDTKKNNGYRSVFIKLFGHVWRGGGIFFLTRCIPSVLVGLYSACL